MRTFQIILALLSGFIIGGISIKLTDTNTLKNISLPEEYKLIDYNTPIKGDYRNGVLYIEFDNSIQFIWNDIEESIPSDGDQLINLYTDENTIYLNPTN
jgi:hypothetical protein